MVQAGAGSEVASALEAVAKVTYGFMNTQMLYVAVKLGIPDLLIEGPRDAEQLAAASSSDARALYRILRALCDTGLLAEDHEHRFSLTAASQPLRSDVPYSLRAMVLAYGGQPWWLAWGNLTQAATTGDTSSLSSAASSALGPSTAPSSKGRAFA